MIPKQGPVIAIDGPAGTGKSSATRRLAEALSYVHVDTGALYRAVAWMAIQKLDPEGSLLATGALDAQLEAETATQIARSVKLEFRRQARLNPSNRIFADGRDLTPLIRTPEISMAASRISSVPGVRAALLGLQRQLGCVGKAILEGRDIGTVVFPDAEVKFFLTASVEERAKRRLIELEAAGTDVPSFAEVKRQIMERDQGDSTRAVAPLRKASDAIEIDTSKLALDEVVQLMESRVREKLGPALGKSP